MGIVPRWIVLLTVFWGAAFGQSMTKTAVPSCTGEHLRASVKPGAIAAVRPHQAMTIALENRSSAACKVEGVPDISFADSVKKPLPVHVCSNCPAYLFPVLPVETVVLQPRKSAYIVVEYTAVAGDAGCKDAATVSLRLTKDGKPVRIHLSGLRTCGVVDVTPLLPKLPPDGRFSGSEAAEDAEK